VRKDKLLITGASGFLGQAVTIKLAMEEKWDIYAIITGRRVVSFPRNVKIISTDLFNENKRTELVESIAPHILLHLAWETNDLFSENNIRWLEASLHLMRLFANNGGQYLLFAGSAREIRGDLGKRKERYQSPEPLCLYGASKLAFTNMICSFLAMKNIQYSVLRYFTLYGPGDENRIAAIPSTIRLFRLGESVVCKNPHNIWDYVYIDDAAEATARVLKAEFCGIVNIASGLPYRMGDVFSEIADIMDRKKLLVLNNEEICHTVLVGDTEILNNQIGYRCRMELREGLEHTVQWWKERLKEE
jgi:nucleoside-diphosphate-sugar epimerase